MVPAEEYPSVSGPLGSGRNKADRGFHQRGPGARGGDGDFLYDRLAIPHILKELFH